MRQVTEAICTRQPERKLMRQVTEAMHKTTRKEADETGNRGYAQDNQKGS